MRIGFGYDVHRLVEGRSLVLGGVKIPYRLGLLGHSDADVLLHAIADALFGAAALGDIGKHFPDTDQTYAGIPSLILLRQTGQILQEHGFVVGNIDSTVVAEQPKIAPYRQEMCQKIAEALEITIDRVSVKATTTEGLGFAGQKEGIAAYAVVTIKELRGEA